MGAYHEFESLMSLAIMNLNLLCPRLSSQLTLNTTLFMMHAELRAPVLNAILRSAAPFAFDLCRRRKLHLLYLVITNAVPAFHTYIYMRLARALFIGFSTG